MNKHVVLGCCSHYDYMQQCAKPAGSQLVSDGVRIPGKLCKRHANNIIHEYRQKLPTEQWVIVEEADGKETL